ncbi:HlyD family secretion protein [Synechococcus sp. HK01-R]|uniref:HlyD family secretion protein n=1 Tax=Synechococcus sp. HK01-R TaxID=2751171 RepID=UPI001627B513|nr:HlyD family efflux transporter periplasmic adaptor subunit [Synechococcus sp. HK01-R]QNG27775.1 HlyD family efflux transporter periplasmic adaptor subunit [Synechococcus sp. HK01-R]
MLLPQEHTVMVRQTSKWGQIFLLSLVGLGATAFATAWFYRIDEVITVQGRLVPQRGGVEVKSPVNGQLAQVLVNNGEQVREGQLLLRFDVKSAKAEEETLSQQLALERERLEDQLRSNAQRQETLERNIALTERILNKLRPLEQGGAISEVQILQQSNQLETQRDELIQLQTQREELINDSNTRRAELQGKLNQLRSQLRNERVKAPISGTVFDLKPDNDRYVTTNAEPLLKIVPKGNLGGEVNVGNQDIGFIKPGQSVKVRVDSFPYTEYGEINGKITRIGADALPPDELIRQYHFPVDLSLERSQLKTREGGVIPLQAGMTITTNLKLRDRRLIELLSDLFTNRGESLKRLRQP